MVRQVRRERRLHAEVGAKANQLPGSELCQQSPDLPVSACDDVQIWLTSDRLVDRGSHVEIQLNAALRLPLRPLVANHQVGGAALQRCDEKRPNAPVLPGHENTVRARPP